MKLAVILLFLVTCLSNAGHAETAYWRDARGNAQSKELKDLPPVPKDGKARMEAKAFGGPTFNVVYEDVVNNTNVGFDDPVHGATRRATVQSVFTYLSSLFDEDGTCDVVFHESQMDGNEELAHATSYYLSNNQTFGPGTVFLHIRSDSNDYAGEDMFAMVDFGYPWNSDLGPPTSNEFDLATVLLHEITHGLGIASLSDDTGEGLLVSNGFFFRRLYTFWDDLMYTGNGTKVWKSNGSLNVPVSALVGSESGLVFRGERATATYGTYPPIFSPNPFAPSSLSHWDDGMSPHAVMGPYADWGWSQRELLPFEVEALADLKYNLRVAKVANWLQYE